MHTLLTLVRLVHDCQAEASIMHATIIRTVKSHLTNILVIIAMPR